MLEHEGKPLKIFWVYNFYSRVCRGCRSIVGKWWGTSYDLEGPEPEEVKLDFCWECTKKLLAEQGYHFLYTEHEDEVDADFVTHYYVRNQ